MSTQQHAACTCPCTSRTRAIQSFKVKPQGTFVGLIKALCSQSCQTASKHGSVSSRMNSNVAWQPQILIIMAGYYGHACKQTPPTSWRCCLLPSAADAVAEAVMEEAVSAVANSSIPPLEEVPAKLGLDSTVIGSQADPCISNGVLLLAQRCMQHSLMVLAGAQPLSDILRMSLERPLQTG